MRLHGNPTAWYLFLATGPIHPSLFFSTLPSSLSPWSLSRGRGKGSTPRRPRQPRHARRRRHIVRVLRLTSLLPLRFESVEHARVQVYESVNEAFWNRELGTTSVIAGSILVIPDITIVFYYTSTDHFKYVLDQIRPPAPVGSPTRN